MRIAIQHRPESFSERWIEYCEENRLAYGLVNCFENDIVEQLKSYQVLLWNWHHSDYREVRAAPHILRAAEELGLVVFPSSDTIRTFDNKLAQKYQFESIGAPLAPTHVFYNAKPALQWLASTTFPKVFKLSRGAGSFNVRLVRNYKEGESLVRKAFLGGFKNSSGHIRENLGKFASKGTRGKSDWLGKVRRLPSSLLNVYRINRMMGREIGYVYFQDFMPDQECDTRVVVVGNRIFAFRRWVREQDFRASGSGLADSDPNKIDMAFVSCAYETSARLKLQCAAYDFVKDTDGNPRILEVSYAFPPNTEAKDCPGHWDKDLKWHEGKKWPQDAIIEDILMTLRTREDVLSKR